MLFTYAVAALMDFAITVFGGMVVLVVLKNDCIENQMVMNMVFINMGGKYKLVLTTQYFFSKLNSDFMGFLGRDFLGLKGLDQVAT